MGIGGAVKICVFGLWHLGVVTAGCLAKKGFTVVGLDPDAKTVSAIQDGRLPVYEPGLDELIKAGMKSGRLTFSANPADALTDTDVVWITFDTPVDEDDRADVAFVEKNFAAVMEHINAGAKVIISSQVPAGFTRKMEAGYAARYPRRKVTFAYSPENLRLGGAINAFENPARVVIGVRAPADKEFFLPVFGRLCDRLEWMRTESAEMTKHALNSFLATSVVFANEIAVLCEKTGADATEVARGLKSDDRIGPKAYLNPGAAFAGGTLARDINFLISLSQKVRRATFLFKAVRAGNAYHKEWIRRACRECFPDLKERTVAVLGLTYKPGTDTLRRSSAVELCRRLAAGGAKVRTFDPRVRELPDCLKDRVLLCGSVEEALKGIDCLIIATPHPEFRKIPALTFTAARHKVVIDAGAFLEDIFREVGCTRYIAVGCSVGNRMS